jgi:PAS domain S-box-containing protein
MRLGELKGGRAHAWAHNQPTSENDRAADDGAELDHLSDGLKRALARVSVPSYVLDRDGTIRWLNAAAKSIVGDARGRHFTEVVAPEHERRTREAFARKLLARDVTDFRVNVVRPDGTRVPLEISSAPIEDRGHVVGVFGLAHPERVDEAAARRGRTIELTGRQHEILLLLAEGWSTREIAERLVLSQDTVRNHIREILRRLRVHSRIAAVAAARQHGLL